LQRLQRRARQDRRIDIAERAQQRTVGAEHDGGPGVTRLDETAALHDREFDSGGNGEGLRHPASLPSAGGDRRVSDCAHVG